MKEKAKVEYSRFDVLDGIKNEEYAALFLKAASEGNPPGWIDLAWEDVKLASERHGFSITPALVDAYTKTRAAATPKPAIA